MKDYQTVLVWIFGMMTVVLVLGSIIKQRRNKLTQQLRDHVDRQLGRSAGEVEVNE